MLLVWLLIVILILNFDVNEDWRFFYLWVLSIWVFLGVKWWFFLLMIFCNLFFVFLVFFELILIIWILLEFLFWLKRIIVCMDFFFNSFCMNLEMFGFFKILMMLIGSLVVCFIILEVKVNNFSLIFWRSFLGFFKYSFWLLLLMLMFKWWYFFGSFWYRFDIFNRISLGFGMFVLVICIIDFMSLVFFLMLWINFCNLCCFWFMYVFFFINRVICLWLLKEIIKLVGFWLEFCLC